MRKTFFRRNTDVFQGKMTRRTAKRPAVRVRWEFSDTPYESALNTLLLIVMLISYPHFRKKGYLLPFYMIGYGVIRCFVEGLRTDSLYLMPGVRVSQVLSGCLILLGVLLVGIIRRRQDIQA